MEFSKSYTNRGKPLLIPSCGGRFIRHKQLALMPEVMWRCSDNKCRCSIFTDLAESKITRQSKEHNHPLPTEQQVQRNALRTECKRKASDCFDVRPDKIVCSALDDPFSTLQSSELCTEDLVAVKQAIRKVKVQQLPKRPVTRQSAAKDTRQHTLKTQEAGKQTSDSSKGQARVPKLVVDPDDFEAPTANTKERKAKESAQNSATVKRATDILALKRRLSVYDKMSKEEDLKNVKEDPKPNPESFDNCGEDDVRDPLDEANLDDPPVGHIIDSDDVDDIDVKESSEVQEKHDSNSKSSDFYLFKTKLRKPASAFISEHQVTDSESSDYLDSDHIMQVLKDENEKLKHENSELMNKLDKTESVLAVSQALNMRLQNQLLKLLEQVNSQDIAQVKDVDQAPDVKPTILLSPSILPQTEFQQPSLQIQSSFSLQTKMEGDEGTSENAA